MFVKRRRILFESEKKIIIKYSKKNSLFFIPISKAILLIAIFNLVQKYIMINFYLYISFKDSFVFCYFSFRSNLSSSDMRLNFDYFFHVMVILEICKIKENITNYCSSPPSSSPYPFSSSC